MKLYALLSRLPSPKSYLGKILLVAFVGIHTPLILLVLYLALLPARTGSIVVALLFATLLGTAATLYALHALLAPVSLAAGALRDYRERGATPDLPTGFPDRAGRLMDDVRHTATELNGVIQSLEDLSTRDPLTRLPNRSLFKDRLGQALVRSKAGRGAPGKVAVLFLDLDDFKAVNDTLGHDAGDELLVTVGDRLRGCFGPRDTLARFGGDEFVVLIEDTGVGEVRRTAQRILQKLQKPFVVGDQELVVDCSIGIVLAEPRDQPQDLLRKADLAMYRAKEEGGGRHTVFREEMSVRLKERRALEHGLRRAVKSIGTSRQEFEIRYQPVILLKTGEVVGAEALLRWKSPEHGFVEPSRFIPLAEQAGLIIPIGGWVILEACRQATQWQKEHPAAPLQVSVNLSTRQLKRSELVRETADVLQKTGLDPGTLCLEITESAMAENSTRTAEVLNELKALGVRLAVDDFGTGYSGLSFLKQFPVDKVKIDRSFVEGIARKSEDEALVAGMVNLAHTLDKEVVAEGIETTEQLDRLRKMTCEKGQGEHFWRPLTHQKMAGLLEAPRRFEE